MSTERSALLNEIKERSTQATVNAGVAAVVSPITVVLQNAMVKKIKTPLMPYQEIYSQLFSKNEGRIPAFRGVRPFALRQAIASGIGFTGTDQLAGSVASPLPYWMQPFAAGFMMGVAEAAAGAKPEAAELRDMIGNPSVRTLTIFKGAVARNGFGWSGGEISNRVSKKYDLLPAQSFWMGVAFGGVSGIMSMPFQNAMVNAARHGGSINNNLRKIIQQGPKAAYAGGMLRMAIMGFYTGGATLAVNILDRMKEPEIQSPSKGCSIC